MTRVSLFALATIAATSTMMLAGCSQSMEDSADSSSTPKTTNTAAGAPGKKSEAPTQQSSKLATQQAEAAP